MSSMLDVDTLYENLFNLRLNKDHEPSGLPHPRSHSTCSSDPPYSSGDPSPVWSMRSLWSPGTEQLQPLQEPSRRPPMRPDRSISLIEGKALPPPPPGFPPLKLAPQAPPSLSSRYKTELCRTFSETGKCKYGAKCQFAHGRAELRALSRHPKYKTELCHKFYLYGECPYGSRCHFIHYPEEQGLAPSSTPQLLRQSISYSGVPTARRSSPPPGIPDPASFTRAPSISPPPANGLLSPSFASLCSESVPRISTLGETMTANAGCCSCQCSKANRLGAFQIRDFSLAPGTPISTASVLTRTPSSNSLSDPDCYSSSSSLSGSDSPVFDLPSAGGPVGSSRRLPIFNRLSVSD
uniref:mRNA decay activator protein ZFP36 n=1 Tax=Sphenodon punctatus TaxID=8508 RepID=A0A8D0H3H1_SPHPU